VRGRSVAARAKLAGLKVSEIGCISSITEAEIRYGLEKAPAARVLNVAIEAFLLKIRIFPWGSEEAFTYGELRARMEASGKTLGNLDMLIAAHAISLGAILVTNDRAFSRIRDLRGVVNWATDLNN